MCFEYNNITIEVRIVQVNFVASCINTWNDSHYEHLDLLNRDITVVQSQQEHEFITNKNQMQWMYGHSAHSRTSL